MTKPEFGAGMKMLTECFGGMQSPMSDELSDAYWHALKDIDADFFARGVRKIIATKTTGWRPTPGEIRAACSEKPKLPSVEIAWRKFRDTAIRCTTKGFDIELIFRENKDNIRVDRFESFIRLLDPMLQEFARRMGREFARNVANDEDDTWNRKEFCERWEALAERIQDEARLPESLRTDPEIGGILNALVKSVGLPQQTQNH